jgi:hypothetical protein
MKLIIGRPNPRFALVKPLPVIVNVAGGAARSTALGVIVIAVTPGAGRVSVTVRLALPNRLKLGVLLVCCQT